MRVEWLNPEMTHAIITRGNRWAETRHQWPSGDGLPRWCFIDTGRSIGWWLNWRVDLKRNAVKRQRARDARRGKEWQPVRALPRAEVRR